MQQINKTYQNLFRTILYIICSIILSCCTNETVCLEGDDFGYDIVEVPATSRNIKGFGSFQYIDWVDSGLNIKKLPIQLIVKPSRYYDGGGIIYSNVWSPWFCNGTNSISQCVNKAGIPPSLFSRTCIDYANISYVTEDVSEAILPEICNIIDGNTVNTSCSTPKTKAIRVTKGAAPCLMGDGVGLYALIVPEDDNKTPNQSPISNVAAALQKSPNGTKWMTFHLGYNPIYPDPQQNENTTSNQIWGGRNAGGITIGKDIKNDKIPDSFQPYMNGRLYFKILDSFYGDNIGKYNVVIRTGAGDNDPGPIQNITEIVIEIMFSAAQIVYQNIIANPYFSTTVNICLSLFIIFYAICFILGVAEFSQKELLIRVFKFSMVAMMLSSDSANYFYNNYLVAIFHEGLDSLISAVTIVPGGKASSNGSTSSTAAYLAILDKPWRMIFSSSIYIKLSGYPFVVCIFSYILGYASLILIAISALQVALSFITCMAMIGFLISFSPIYIVFLLFQQTRHLFDAWFKILSANFLQAVIVIAGFNFLFAIYYNFFYKLLGSRVCPEAIGYKGVDIFSVWNNSCSGSNAIIGNVQLPFPSNVYACSSTPGTPDTGLSPAGTTCTEQVFPAFESIPNRNINLPTVDIKYDHTIYDAIVNGDHGKLILLFVLLIILSWIIFGCVKLFPKLASAISGTGYDYASPQAIADKVYDIVGNKLSYAKDKFTDKLGKKMKESLKKTKNGKRALAVYDFATNIPEGLGTLAGTASSKLAIIPRKASRKIKSLPGIRKIYKLQNDIDNTLNVGPKAISKAYAKYSRRVDDLQNSIMRGVPIVGDKYKAREEEKIKARNKKILEKRRALQFKYRNDQTLDAKLQKFDDLVKDELGVDIRRDLL